MEAGYVLDLSDRTFGELVEEAVGADIHSDRYKTQGTSKANKLRAFWKLESDHLVGTLLLALFDYVASLDANPWPEQVEAIDRANQVAIRLLAGGPSLGDLKAQASKFNASYMAEQIRRMERAVESDPSLAIGTAKELVETCCKTILAERGKQITGTPDVSTLTKQTLKELNLVPDGIDDATRGADVIKRLLSNLGTIGNGLAELRGLYGTGHGKHGGSSSLRTRHAKLAVGAASTLAVFFLKRIKNLNHNATRLPLHHVPHATAETAAKRVANAIALLTPMLLSEITIRNFRGIEELTINLDRCTILIGENNTGKTSVLEAVHTCLSRNLSRRVMPFSEYDFHLTAAVSEPTGAPPIEILFTFVETAENEWPDAVIQGLEKAVQVRGDNKQEVRFKVAASYDAGLKDYSLEWSFLDLNNNELPTAKNPRLVAEMQQLNPAFFLTAVRDSAQHFQPKSPFWAPFTKNPQIDDETRVDLENQIADINQAVLDAHKPFEEVKAQVARTGTLVPLAAADLVSVEAIPARIFDMLNKTQVKLAAKSGAKLPIGQHGAGTQSLSVMFLFNAFLNARLAEAFDKDAEPLLSLEEPESHLHPSAVRSLWAILNGLKGQKIVATHSGELLAAVPLTAVRRLARKGGKVQVFQVKQGSLTAVDERKIAYHVRAKRGNLLFAKSWLLVEGESEYWFLPEAARLLGSDLELEGVCVVEFARMRRRLADQACG